MRVPPLKLAIYPTVFLAVLLAVWGCKTRPVTDRGDHGERVAANQPPLAAGQGIGERSGRDHGVGEQGIREHRLPSTAEGHDHLGPLPFAECPVAGDSARKPDKLLARAVESYAAGAFAIAYSCADMATELLDTSVEAHHIRAAAAAALGRHDIARLAFALALALDPDDPETLAAAAEFYINVLPPRHRDTTSVGLEYARRGRLRARAKNRRIGRSLRARLALLEAQAYNDLGRGDEALERVDRALSLAPALIEARHERGVALFNLCRFDEALEQFKAVLVAVPDDPYAHHHLGLIYERMGEEQASDDHFHRARELAPGDFWPPVLLSPAEFRSETERAVAELPGELRQRLAGVVVEIADIPARADLVAVTPPFSPTILGLFRGLPDGIEVAGGLGHNLPPQRAIVLYRKNLARAAKTRTELDDQIRRTLLHEIGHLSGLDEGDLRRRGLD
ncbi:MAG: metallopeptidase family protein [Proteobacteria bacterium]|nr:metallopeptidase family protein [Pseudomonadota bacterium]